MGFCLNPAQSAGILTSESASRRPLGEQRGEALGHLTMSGVFNAMQGLPADSPERQHPIGSGSFGFPMAPRTVTPLGERDCRGLDLPHSAGLTP